MIKQKKFSSTGSAMLKLLKALNFSDKYLYFSFNFQLIILRHSKQNEETTRCRKTQLDFYYYLVQWTFTSGWLVHKTLDFITSKIQEIGLSSVWNSLGCGKCMCRSGCILSNERFLYGRMLINVGYWMFAKVWRVPWRVTPTNTRCSRVGNG